jgi:hypothetical protein
LYGIRVYQEGAIMMPHVDRLPLVVSAVISVAVSLQHDGASLAGCIIILSHSNEGRNSQY